MTIQGRTAKYIYQAAAVAVIALVSCSSYGFFNLNLIKNKIHLVQDGNGAVAGGVATLPMTFTNSPHPGGFIWVSAAVWLGNVTSVTDNQGNIYSPAFAITIPACNAGVYGYYALNVASSGAFTVTVHGTSIQSAAIREYSGVIAVGAFDQTNPGIGNSALGDSGPITTAKNGELYIAAQTHCSTLTTSSGAGWGNFILTTDDNGGSQALSTEDRIGPTMGTYNGTFGFSAIDNWAVGIASFK